VDVAEIGFETLAREMSQRDERFLVPRSVLPHIALHLGVLAAVVVFVAEAPKDLGGGVPLLGRGGFVVEEDLVDDRLERPQLGGRTVSGQRLGMWLSMLEGMTNGFSGVSESSSDLSDGHAIASRPPNRAIIVHGNHVLCLRVGECPCRNVHHNEGGWGGSRLRDHIQWLHKELEAA
jgi:hypothetical protein